MRQSGVLSSWVPECHECRATLRLLKVDRHSLPDSVYSLPVSRYRRKPERLRGSVGDSDPTPTTPEEGEEDPKFNPETTGIDTRPTEIVIRGTPVPVSDGRGHSLQETSNSTKLSPN